MLRSFERAISWVTRKCATNSKLAARCRACCCSAWCDAVRSRAERSEGMSKSPSVHRHLQTSHRSLVWTPSSILAAARVVIHVCTHSWCASCELPAPANTHRNLDKQSQQDSSIVYQVIICKCIKRSLIRSDLPLHPHGTQSSARRASSPQTRHSYSCSGSSSGSGSGSDTAPCSISS